MNVEALTEALENALGKPIEFLDIAGAVGEKIVENNETLTNSN